MSQRQVEENIGISCTFVRQVIKRRGIKQFKCLKITMMSSAMQERLTKEPEPWWIGLGKVILSKKVILSIWK